MKPLNSEIYQPPSPVNYTAPTVVQPIWQPLDLVAMNYKDAKKELTTQLAKQYGVKYCLLLDRARSGLNLLINAFGLDGEWITTSMMHRPTGVLLKQQCKNLVFADVNSDFTISSDSVRRVLSTRSNVILATHLYGKVADVATLREIADQHGLALIENAVHMPGGFDSHGKRVGSWGDATIVSFNIDKPLGGLMGGALLTNRKDIWEAVQNYQLAPVDLKEVWGRVFTTYLAYRLKPLLLKTPFGKKYRGISNGVTEIEQFSIEQYKEYTSRQIHTTQALAALKSLDRLDNTLEIRYKNSKTLTDMLKNNDLLDLPTSDAHRPHTYTYYPIVLRNGKRLELGKVLADLGIETKWRYYPLHLQKDFSSSKKDSDMSNTERLWKNHLLIPTGVNSNDKHIMHLAEALHIATDKL